MIKRHMSTQDGQLQDIKSHMSNQDDQTKLNRILKGILCSFNIKVYFKFWKSYDHLKKNQNIAHTSLCIHC